jgi:nitroreductase
MAKQFEDPNFKNMFRNATNVIFISHRPGPCTQLDCGLMAGNMVNAAKSLGVSSVIMMGPIGFFSTEAGKPFLDALALSEGQELLICIGMGYSDEKPETPERKYSKVKYVQ